MNFSFKNRRRVLLVANAAMVTGIVLLIVWAVTAGPAPKQLPPIKTTIKHANSVTRQDIRPLEDYLAIAQKSLRKSLTETESPKTIPVSTVKPSSLSIRLIGTVVEAGHSYGLFEDSSGDEKLLAVGDTIDGAEIIKVEDGSAVVKFNNEMVALEVPKPEELSREQISNPPPPPTAPTPTRAAIRNRRRSPRSPAAPPAAPVTPPVTVPQPEAPQPEPSPSEVQPQEAQPQEGQQ